MLTEKTIDEFVQGLADAKRLPGGGSAAALSGFMAVHALQLAIQCTLAQNQKEEVRLLLLGKMGEAEFLGRKLKELVDRDAEVLGKLLELVGHGSEDMSGAEVQQAFREAAEVPLGTARGCLEVLEMGRYLFSCMHPFVLGDLMGGMALARAGLTGALCSTAMNLPAIRDQLLVQALEGQMLLLKNAGEELMTNLEKRVFSQPGFTVLAKAEDEECLCGEV